MAIVVAGSLEESAIVFIKTVSVPESTSFAKRYTRCNSFTLSINVSVEFGVQFLYGISFCTDSSVRVLWAVSPAHRSVSKRSLLFLFASETPKRVSVVSITFARND